MFRNSTMAEPDGEIDERAVRHNIKKFSLLYLGFVFLCAVVGGIFAAFAPHHRRQTHHHASTAGVIVGIVVLVVMVGIVVATMYWIFHRRSYRRVMQYSWNRRRRVFRALRKGRPLSAEDRPVADAIMYLNRNWRRNILILFPLATLYVLVEAAIRSGNARWPWIGLAVIYVLTIPLALWNQHRIERNYHRFIRSGPPPAPTG